LGVEVHACHPNAGNKNRRTEVQACPDIKARQYQKLTKAKRAWGHGSSGTVPALSSNPSNSKNRKKKVPTWLPAGHSRY
jgi:hypothetical protein